MVAPQHSLLTCIFTFLVMPNDALVPLLRVMVFDMGSHMTNWGTLKISECHRHKFIVTLQLLFLQRRTLSFTAPIPLSHPCLADGLLPFTTGREWILSPSSISMPVNITPRNVIWGVLNSGP